MELMEQVLSAMNDLFSRQISATDVERALDKEMCGPEEFAAFLSSAAGSFLEPMAQAARRKMQRYFGCNINLFTPLYIANYCENHCVYCGFNCKNKISRACLNEDEIEREMVEISKTGLKEILLLTGESRAKSDVNYIGRACSIARKYFSVIGLEIYPINSDEYRFLHECGVDYVTVFQETYNQSRYKELHLSGNKRDFSYRFNTQERAIKGGMRGIGFGALLGLDDFRKDALGTGLHAFLIQKKYPQAEISLSCPRIRPTVNQSWHNEADITEVELLQVICAYRLFLPYANIIISTRESEKIRDNLILIAANKISAGVSTGIGGHSGAEKGDAQFEIADSRNVNEIYCSLKERGLQPVMRDYVYVG